MINSQTLSGIACSIFASVLFGVLYYYFKFIPPMKGEDIYAWRMLSSVPFMSLMFFLRPIRKGFIEIVKRIRHRPVLLMIPLASSQLLALQTWLFMWAPVNGYAMEVSVGYLLLPLTLALAGKLLFREVFGPYKLAAFLIAVTGFLLQIFNGQPVSWPTLVVCLGYPIYFVLRRLSRTNNLGGLVLDMYLNVPLCTYLVITSDTGMELTSLNIVILSGMGLISAAALLLMMAASQKLNMILFGLLNYVEPFLLILVSFLLAQYPSRNEYFGYACIFMSVLVLMAEGIISLKRKQRR